ncbi:hypothetical protein LTR86_006969 [Recurvomyces mirabilis]|nr:hypothetical protein LTR86_006969 [Recurvomyces mirabilis]
MPMPLFRSIANSNNAGSALRTPAQRRISAPVSIRLSTITEGANAGQPENGVNDTRQSRSHIRSLDNVPDSPGRLPPYRQASRSSAGGRSQDTGRTAPPAYTWVPDPIEGEENLRAPVEGEKLAELRRNGGHLRKARQRGGWGRAAVVAAVVLLVVGLAVGLGVGLTAGRKHPNSSSADQAGPSGATSPDNRTQVFPLGEYSLLTNLREVNTSCTSNPATWRCYPYTVFNLADSSTNTSSAATFNWIITNTSSTYATNTSSSTPSEGIPANLTISSTNNPFSIIFTNQSLTYISLASNTSSPRLTFNFTQSKSVIPSTSITSNGATAECFFNSTVFTGTLYLDAPRTYPYGQEAQRDSSIGGFEQWPYAVEILQASPGGQDVPACYQMINGGVGDRILTAGTAMSEESRCLCDYRNY